MKDNSINFTSLVCDLEKALATHSSTLAWKIPWMEKSGGLRSMGSQSHTQLSDFTFTFHFHALEKEMATHSSVLAWRIPGMGEPGGLSSMGSIRVGHDWSDLAAAAVCDIDVQAISLTMKKSVLKPRLRASFNHVCKSWTLCTKCRIEIDHSSSGLLGSSDIFMTEQVSKTTTCPTNLRFSN